MNVSEKLLGLTNLLNYMLMAMGTGRNPMPFDFLDFLVENHGSLRSSVSLEFQEFSFDVSPEHFVSAIEK